MKQDSINGQNAVDSTFTLSYHWRAYFAKTRSTELVSILRQRNLWIGGNGRYSIARPSWWILSIVLVYVEVRAVTCFSDSDERCWSLMLKNSCIPCVQKSDPKWVLRTFPNCQLAHGPMFLLSLFLSTRQGTHSKLEENTSYVRREIQCAAHFPYGGLVR